MTLIRRAGAMRRCLQIGRFRCWRCGGVSIDRGDLVFGDVDGVVVIPRSHEHAVMDLALEKVRGEDNTRDALLQVESLANVFKRLGIL